MRSTLTTYRLSAGLTALALAVTCASVPAAAQNEDGTGGPPSAVATDNAAIAAAQNDNYVDGSESVGSADWLADATGRKRVFIQTRGTSALMALSKAEKKGISAAAARRSARTIADATIAKTNVIVDAVKQLDPAAFEMYGSQYTVPGVAMEASAVALRKALNFDNVVTIVELPYYERPALETATGGSISTQTADGADLIRAIAAWQAGHTGQDVVVAVADSGFDYTHSDFGGPGTTAAYNTAKSNPAATPQSGWFDSTKVKGMIDLAGATGTGQNPDGNPIPTVSGFDHGTHVAGIVAGWGVNTNGTRFAPSSYSSVSAAQVKALKIGPGMAPNAKLWPIKIFADGSSGGTSLGVASLEYVAQQAGQGNKIDVINQSIGSDWGQVNNTYKENALQVLNQYGIIAVISEGNGGDYVDIGGSPGVQERALTVASADNTVTNGSVPISSFSSRGAHGSYDGRVKPDLTAIGGSVVSAYSGTGSNSTPASGTSMSSPMTAGAAAVAIGAHPGWKANNDNAALRFKALMMNTASSGVADAAGRKYSLTRTGTGLVNTADAAKSKVWLASDQNDHLVTASFGVVEASGPTTLTRTVTVHNDGASQVTFNTGYVPFTAVPGVNFTASPAQISIAAGAAAKVTVTLSIPDPLALRRTIDPTMSSTTSDGKARQYVTEASGILDLQSTDPANVPWLRLGVFAAPKPATKIVGQAPVFAGSDPLKGTLTFGGTGLDFGATSFAEAAQPLSMGFQWGITDDNNNVDERDYTRRSADTDVVGAATNAPELAEKSNGTLYFAIAGRGNRARPVTGMDSVSATIELTTKFNNAKYRLELVQPKNQGSSKKDDRYVVRTIRLSDNAVVETQSVNGYDAGLDTNAFDSNVWILTVNLKNIGFAAGHTGSTEIEYKARLIADSLNDDTGTITYDVYNPDLWFERPASWNSHFVRSVAGTNLVIHRKSQDTNAKVLLVHMHNVSGTRTQVLDVPPDTVTSSSPPVITGLPRVGQTLTATPGQWTGAATFGFAYQWLRGGQAIGGATGSSYTVAAGDEGKAFSVRVTATRGTKSGTATSASVTVHDGSPVATVPPAISGLPVAGATLAATPGTWLDADGATFAYQWLRGGQAIGGATGPTYPVAAQDERADLSVRVSATAGGRTGQATSAAVTVVPLSGSAGAGQGGEDESTAGLGISLSAATQAYGKGGVIATVRVPRAVVVVGAVVKIRSGETVLGQKALAADDIGIATSAASGYLSVEVPISATAAAGRHSVVATYTVQAGATTVTLTSASTVLTVTAGGSSTPPKTSTKPGTKKAAKKGAKITLKVSKKSVRAGATVKVRVKVTAGGKAASGKVAIRVGKKTVKVVKLKKGKRNVKVKLKKAGKQKITVRFRGSAKVKPKTSKAKVVRVLRAV
ncbi:hypothetical protein GCM10010401_09950 [Rarobacter faecitabidus]|uniref:Subtilisin family serine protease n=1 Tax=Rarobacter faecitabidus TaxID=13243 RepID=A0A542ZA54_RARFA|nr:subtilisin family serine protease [Rarobacter faecitabidus]